MNVQEELKALKDRIAELEEHTKEEQEFPKDGDSFYSISEIGNIESGMIWGGYPVDMDRMAIGNVFHTREEAQFAAEKLKVEAELRKYSKRPNPNGVNWFIVCADSEEVYTLYTTQEISQGTIYFESKKLAQQAVQSVGVDRIKKYIFGVED